MGRRQGIPSTLLLPLLIVLTAATGCAGGPGEAASRGETTSADEARQEAPPRERTGEQGRPHDADSRAEAAYPLGGAYVPAGFGEGSLWATDVFTCDDTGPALPPDQYDASGGEGASAACAAPAGMFLKRLNPETGEEEAAIELEGFFANVTEVAFGAGSVWVSPADYHPGPDPDYPPGGTVLRVDPRTNRVVDRIPVSSPSGVAFGHGYVWATSAGRGTLWRVDPETGEVAEVAVGRGAVDVAVDERGGAVWVAGLHLPTDYGESPSPGYSGDRKLSRVDPETMRVVAEVPVRANSPTGGAQGVDVGEGAVWATSVGGELLKVDRAANEILAATRIGDYSSDLAVSGGSVWATAQASAPGNVGTRLVRVDPQTVEVSGSRALGGLEASGPGRLAAGGGHVWFLTGGAEETGAGTLARISP